MISAIFLSTYICAQQHVHVTGQHMLQSCTQVYASPQRIPQKLRVAQRSLSHILQKGTLICARAMAVGQAHGRWNHQFHVTHQEMRWLPRMPCYYFPDNTQDGTHGACVRALWAALPVPVLCSSELASHRVLTPSRVRCVSFVTYYVTASAPSSGRTDAADPTRADAHAGTVLLNSVRAVQVTVPVVVTRQPGRSGPRITVL